VAYDQLILEYPPTGWVHFGLRVGGPLRTEALIFDGNKYARV
jgi:hypothetical protein